MPFPTIAFFSLTCLAALSLQSHNANVNVNAFQSPLTAQSPLITGTASRNTPPSALSLSTPGGGGGFGNREEATTASSKPKASLSPAGDFAFQEMIVFLSSMQKDGVTSRDMDPAKRSELEGYVRSVLTNLGHQSLRLQDIGQAVLPKSDWKLMFSTSDAVLESLPNDATVFLNIHDEENLDYILKFSKKTMGLDSLTAKCKYTVDAGPVQPGLLTFVYDKITTNIMGLNNIGVGFFGMLKGRANYVESAYFDGSFWIERGVSPTGDGDFINVYMRMDG